MNQPDPVHQAPGRDCRQQLDLVLSPGGGPLKSKHPKLVLDDLEVQIGSVIRRHREANPVPVRVLMNLTGLIDPVVRSVVSGLVVIHGLPVGSRAGNKNPGYYWIDNATDLERASQSLYRRGVKILVRASKLKKKNMDDVVGQLRVEGFQENNL